MHEPALPSRMDTIRAEQTQLAVARLVVVATFILLWASLWLAGIPYPLPFLYMLLIEAAIFAAYAGAAKVLHAQRVLEFFYYGALALELVTFTMMMYFLGGLTYFGSYAYIFGLIFSTAFFDVRRGLVYTAGALVAYCTLAVLDATQLIAHYSYLDQDPLRYRDPRFVLTTLFGTAGVFFGIFVWVNWVGRQLKRQRDVAVAAQDALSCSQAELEERVEERTSALVEATAQARASADLLSSTMESTADGILVVGDNGKVAYTNGRFAEMWRIPTEILATQDDERLIEFVLDQLAEPNLFLDKVRELYQSEREDLDVLVFKDGREFERYSRPLLNDGANAGRVWSFRDVSERRRSEEKLIQLANQDSLTGLLNRRRFHEEIERNLAEAHRYGVRGALLFLDLDQFKDVNDSRGHRVGDELIQGVARIVRERVRETDIAARLGGDEFSVLLPHTDRDQALTLAGDLLEAIRSHTFVVGDAPLRITASIGVALVDQELVTASDLLARADFAMYKAKDEGRNRASLFETGADWQAEIESRIGWQQRVREALETGLFELHAQPILDLAQNQVTRLELLLRMKKAPPGQGLVLPGKFLEIAERSGLIQDIDRWVVREAIRTLAELQLSSPDVGVEVNLSGKAFGDHGLLELIRHELESVTIDPAMLIFEVTETAAIANIDDAQTFIRTLKSMGCRFALDDFGVGFSSFSHLKHLPVDYLKIDGSFIRELARDPVDRQLVQAIVRIARGLHKKTIAEFVEDEQTLDLLREYGVDYAQGYYVGEPMPLSHYLSPRQAA